MKRLIGLAVLGLLLSGCSVRESQTFVKCWQQDPDGQYNTVIYSGYSSSPVGIGTRKADGVSFITFHDENNEEVDVWLTNRICVVGNR